MAREARVSPAVVSRVFNGDPKLRLKEETRTAVLRAIEELGYTPHSAAQGLRSARTRTIGLVLDQVTSPMLTEVVAEAQRAALRADYIIVIVDAEEVGEGLARVRSMIAANRIDGLLLQAGFGDGAGRVLDLATEVPAVVLNEPGTCNLSSVHLDDESAVRLATRHLIDLGHRHLAFVATHASTSSDRRRDAFLLEIRAAAERVTGTVVPSAGWTPRQSHDAVAGLLRKGASPTGFVAANTVSAVGVLSGIAAAGISVPDEASVIAIHDTWFAPHLNPPLTTVRLPLRALGGAAVELLIARLNGGEVTHLAIDDPAPLLVRRKSTGAPPAAAAPRRSRQAATCKRGEGIS